VDTKEMNPKRFARYCYLKFIRLKGDPRSLARGSAIGAFLAVTPIMPVRTIVIIASTAFLRVNMLAALIIATVISNPLTYIPLYYCAMVTGNAITPYTLNWDRVNSVLDIIISSKEFTTSIQAVGSLGLEAFIVLMLGGIVLAIPVSLVTYSLSLRFFISREQKAKLINMDQT
jgi:uncharacterized protein (DUF2062 family)